MPLITITVKEIPGHGLADATLEQLTPTREKMQLVGQFVYNQIWERFKTNGSSGGKSWSDHWLGDDSGHQKMFEAYDWDVTSDNSVVIGTDDPYAEIQEYGTKKYGGQFNTIFIFSNNLL